MDIWIKNNMCRYFFKSLVVFFFLVFFFSVVILAFFCYFLETIATNLEIPLHNTYEISVQDYFNNYSKYIVNCYFKSMNDEELYFYFGELIKEIDNDVFLSLMDCLKNGEFGANVTHLDRRLLLENFFSELINVESEHKADFNLIFYNYHKELNLDCILVCGDNTNLIWELLQSMTFEEKKKAIDLYCSLFLDEQYKLVLIEAYLKFLGSTNVVNLYVEAGYSKGEVWAIVFCLGGYLANNRRSVWKLLTDLFW